MWSNTGWVCQKKLGETMTQSVQIKLVIIQEFKDVVLDGIKGDSVVDLINVLGLGGALLKLSQKNQGLSPRMTILYHHACKQ